MVAVAAVALHPACRHRLTLPCKQPWQRPQLGQQQQRQQWRPKGNAERRPPPPPALPPAAAASSGDALPQPSAAAAGAGGRPGGGFWLAARRWAAAHAAPLSSPAANRKLLALSLGQMLASVASDLHDTYLGLYLREVLQMSNTHMGGLHAALQLLPPLAGVLSGRLADLLTPARMVVLGSVLTAAACKPMFALCGAMRLALGTSACAAWLAAAKVLDRFVKGLREAPSKALIGELAAQSGDSAAGAFALRHALSTAGMLLGAAASALAFKLSGGSYEATFVLSALPAALGALLVAAALRGGGEGGGAQPSAAGRSAAGASAAAAPSSGGSGQKGAPPRWGALGALLGALSPGYWQALAVCCLLHLARYDVSWRAVHASSVMGAGRVPSLTLFSMLPVIVLATPLGMRAKASVAARNAVLLGGIAACVAANACLALVPSLPGVLLGALGMGLHIAASQGALLGMLAAHMPRGEVPGLGRASGTAWALTDLLLGCSLAGANLLAGRLNDWSAARGWGSTGCFMGAVAAAAAAMAALLAFGAWGELGREAGAAAPAPQ